MSQMTSLCLADSASIWPFHMPLPTGQDALDSLPEPPIEFRNNSGKGGEVFNAEHPYFDVPKSVAAKIEEQL